MASATSGPSANGTTSPDLPEDVMVDGQQLPELSVPPITSKVLDTKTLDGNWDADSLESPRSCSSASTSSIGSPGPSYVTRSKSRAMKPRRNQSAYYDNESGLWKCRNCGGTYEVPNPGSRQRREHKKACEETQRLKALQKEKQEQEDKAKRDELALRAKESEEASDSLALIAGKDADQLLQKNSQGSASTITEDHGIMGALNTTPAIPEKEEVNFGAPKELIHNVDLKARESVQAGPEQETYWKDAQSQDGNTNDQEPRHGQGEAGLDQMGHRNTEAAEERHLPSEQNHPAQDKGPADTDGSPLKTENSGESESVNESSTPDSMNFHPNGSPYQHWVDKRSSPPIEQVKYCSSAAPNSLHVEGTLYDQLMDLHDDPLAQVTRSVSFSRGSEETSRIASLNREKEAALGRSCKRALSLDFGVEMEMGMDHNVRAPELDDGFEAGNAKDPKSDLSPDRWVEVLVGRDHSRPSSLNEGVETQQNYGKTSRFSGGVDMKQNYGKAVLTPEQSLNAAVSSRTKSYRPRTVASRSEQAGTSKAVASSSGQSQSDSPQKDASNRNRSTSSQEEDDDFGAMVVRNVGKFWKHIASVGAVAVVAWVGKSLAERHQRSQESAPRRGRGRCAMNRCYCDDY